MEKLNIVYFSVTSNEIPNLSSAASEFQNSVAPLNLFARTRTQLENSEDKASEFIEKSLGAHVVIITLMSGSRSFPGWEKLIKKIKQSQNNNIPTPLFHVQPTGSNKESMEMVQKYSSGLNTGLWKTLNQYYRYGGKDNLKQMLICLYNQVFDQTLPRKEPVKLPTDGIYHPKMGHIQKSDDYFKTLDPEKPTIGIWFYQNFYTTGNKDHIDALIHRAEKAGANVICVFHTRFRDKRIKSKGVDEIIEQYFMVDGSPRIDVLINPVMFSLSMADPSYKNLMSHLDVPVIQAMTTGRSIKEWEQTSQGLNIVDITIGVAQPELDGVIVGMVVAAKQFSDIDPVTGSAVNRYVPIPERIDKIICLAMNFAALGRIASKNKKIAIVFHHYPPRNDRIGCASGLDTFASINTLLGEMKKKGYYIKETYKSGDMLAKKLLGAMTCDQHWLLPEQMAYKTMAKAGPDQYIKWHKKLPGETTKKMTDDWGKMPGDLFVHDNQLLFPGIVNGNIFLTIQPPRGYLEQIDKLYHDPGLSPPHHYLAQYRWIKHIFKADAILHVGKHGSLEWLPGKAVGLSNNCYPDLAIMDIPNIYIYIINDPGEGTQAKRRSSACIVDHLPPALVNADLYDELAELGQMVSDFQEMSIVNPSKQSVMVPLIWEAAVRANIDKDLNINKHDALADFNHFIEQVHGYLGEISDTTITKGLHVLGTPPMDEDLAETLVQFTRIANGKVPSLRSSIINALGYDHQQVIENTSKIIDKKNNLTGTDILKKAHAIALSMIRELVLKQNKNIENPMEKTMEKYLGVCDAHVFKALDYAVNNLLPRISDTKDEVLYCLKAFEGKFVPPGPSGAPSRGMADILPTGKNFYSVDPQKIPNPGAWETGKLLADSLIARYLKEFHCYPDSVGIILWASPTMRSKGDDVAEILYLLGVKPVWQKGSGNVRNIKVIPLSQLNRPRIDVLPKISGIFRDAFPLLVELIDKAVQMVAVLNEPLESNMIKNHVTKDIKELVQDGMDMDKAFRQATFRLYGAAPGSYGTAVTELIESKKWKTSRDLGDIFIQWSSYAYGQGIFGRQSNKGFKKALKRISVTVKNEDSREKDMMTCTDFYGYHGGLISAVESVQKKSPFSITGDSSDPENIRTRTAKEEANHVLRSRILNPKWIKGLKAHGYKGAGDISKAMDIIFGWDATSGVIDDYMYKSFAAKTVLDTEIRQWMQKVNPYALENILNKLLEADARQMWKPDSLTIEKLKDIYLEIEGDIEGLNM